MLSRGYEGKLVLGELAKSEPREKLLAFTPALIALMIQLVVRY
jgi:hypothetical protein